NKKISTIGNAIVDLLAFADNEFLKKANLEKGSMSLIDENQTKFFLENLKIEKIAAGGSAANTIHILADLGIETGFFGKIGEDDYGELFSQGLKKSKISFHSLNHQKSDKTAISFILVSEDGQRTMATFLGDAGKITSKIDEEKIKNSEIFYVEGYLWDDRNSIKHLKEAIDFANKNGVKTAFTLSDSFCVSRHKEDFLKIVSTVLIIFANQDEIESLFGERADLLKIAVENQTILAITKDKNGAEIFDGINGKQISIPTQFVENIIDTTGAGDSFAAGFFYGLNKGFSLAKSAKIGNLIAGEIIQTLGAKLPSATIHNLNKKIECL
ncbi:adenosine kinase, partial [Flavobacteriaceae bacterium]|nr:adenosine kinase [Flavobacteriaceae bacterium]